MKNLITLKVIAASNDEAKAQDQQGMRTLTNEEILAVAGGPEVDVESGNGG